MADEFTYYAIIDEGFDINNPMAVVRRRIVNGLKHDESFTINMRWEHSNSLRDIEWGHSDHDFHEISEGQTDVIISRWIEKFKVHKKLTDETGPGDQPPSE